MPPLDDIADASDLAAADAFRRAADLVRNDPRRRGSLLDLAAPADVLIAGDIHGRRESLRPLLRLLEARPAMTLILQEIIHGPLDPETGHDLSGELLLQAVRAKLAHPQRVHFVLGNHDVAQITRSEITKKGRGVCRDFISGMTASFGPEAPEVYMAAMSFLRALPLAVRFANGVLAAHSLPSPNRAHLGPVEILDRPLAPDDLNRGGAAYEWTWGRDQSPEQLDELADRLAVRYFVPRPPPPRRGAPGHRPQRDRRRHVRPPRLRLPLQRQPPRHVRPRTRPPFPHRPPMSLTGRERRHLRSMGQRLADDAAVGKDGFSADFLDHVRNLFFQRELLKIRLLTEHGAARKRAAEELAAALDADVAGVVGRTVLLYRRNDEAPMRVEFP